MNTNRKSKFSNIKWTSELDNFIINSHFNKKESLVKIGNYLGITSLAISRRIKKLGYLPINYQNLQSYTFEDVVSLLNQGKTLTQIGKYFNVSTSSLSKLLHKNNYKIDRRSFNENVFDCIDTEEKAYWLGFIYADGNISNYSNKKPRYAFEISLKGEDKEHLIKFNKFMEFNGNNVKKKIIKLNGKEYISYRWVVNNKHLWETLNSHGCVPKKIFNS